jgi:hypothetical protein
MLSIAALAPRHTTVGRAGRVDPWVMNDILNDPIASTLEEAAGFVEAQAARVTSLRKRLADEDVSIPVIDRLAEELDALGDRLGAIDGEDVVDVARGLARRRGPWLFAAGGAAIGLLAWGGLRRAQAPEEEPGATGALESSTDRDSPRAA